MDSFPLVACSLYQTLIIRNIKRKKEKNKEFVLHIRIHYWIERVSLLKQLPLSFPFTTESSFRT
jgi:hypothetical protein